MMLGIVASRDVVTLQHDKRYNWRQSVTSSRLDNSGYVLPDLSLRVWLGRRKLECSCLDADTGKLRLLASSV